MTKGLLEDVKVVDWSQFYAGPGATALLGDMGADIVLIERVGKGDPTREMTSIGGADYSIPGGRNALFEAVGRNKRSIALDLDSETGQSIAHRLVQQADVFHTNFRRPALEKKQMDPKTLRGLNDRLIYSRISGYGPEGPLKDRGAFDFMVQGYSGMLHAMGDEDTEIAPPTTLIIDQTTSVFAAHAVVGALYHRLRTGEGQEVHTSLLGTSLTAFYFHAFTALLTGQSTKKHSRRRPGNVLRNYYRCADGKWLICAHNPRERYWDRFMAAVGLDPTAVDRNQEETELVALLDEQFAKRTRDEWIGVGREHDLFFAPVNTFAEAAHEEQVAVNYLDQLAHPSMESIKYPGFATTYSETPVRPRRVSPSLGEHTDEILSAAGYSAGEIAKYREEGVVG